ncbi:MAG: serine hydrolase domain-containing protein [Candidatus Binataceae bacterium]
MTSHITRRTSLKQIALAATASVFPTAFGSLSSITLANGSEPTPSEVELASMEGMARVFMQRYEVPGLSMAITCHGQFVYRKAFGRADQDARERATPSNLFRIGSVSKPITAITIFRLIENNRLKLNDFVFGRDGILGFDYGSSYPDRVQRIRIDHLLTHTCGWTTGADPTFSDNDLSQAELIKVTVRDEPLQYEPGAHWAYSNFGYFILGRVVEKLSGQTYEQFAQQNVLAKCGVTDMRIGGNTLAERAPGEVAYDAGYEVDPYAFNVRRMDSDGGWIASASDLVQVAMHVDGFSYTPSILKESTIETMTEPCPISPEPHYAKGWFVKANSWWHPGSLPGATSILVRLPSGMCWAALANIRAPGILLALDRLMWAMARAVPEWHVDSPSR